MSELDRELAAFEKLPLPNEAEAERLCAMIFDEKKVEALVAERDGRIEGMAIYWQGLGSSFRARPFLFLEDLVVAESARSGSVGEALVAALAREGVRRKVMRIDWAVLDWNVNAMRFYRRIGAGPLSRTGSATRFPRRRWKNSRTQLRLTHTSSSREAPSSSRRG